MADSVITLTGKNEMLNLMFASFEFMAAGTDTSGSGYTESSTQLNNELTIGSNGYSRAALNNIKPGDNGGTDKTVKSEAVFGEDNITSSTTIKEIGIVNSATTSGQKFWCLYKVPPMTKTNEIEVKFTIITTVG